MTIALGILAKDGLVIAADTQETYSGVFKIDQGKMLGTRVGPPNAPLGFVTVTGAGTAGTLDAINQEICNNVGSIDAPSFQRVQSTIAATILDFNVKHVAPFATWPDYDRPSCSLVIGAALGNRTALWTTDKSSIKQCLYGAVGIGAPHANLLLGRLWRHNLSLDVVARLAAYVMFWVKQNVDGCGKDTQIVLMQDGKGWTCEVKRTELMEEQFGRYMDLEERTARYVIGIGTDHPIGGTANRTRTLRSVRAELKHIFTNYQVDTTESDYRRSRVPLWTPDRDETEPPPRPKSPSRRRRVGR